MKKIRSIALTLVFCMLCSFIPVQYVQAATSLTLGTEMREYLTGGISIGSIIISNPDPKTYNFTVPETKPFSLKLSSKTAGAEITGKLIKLSNNEVLKPITVNGGDAKSFDITSLDKGDYAFEVSGNKNCEFTILADFSLSAELPNNGNDFAFGEEVSGEINGSHPQANHSINLPSPGILDVTVGAEMGPTIVELKDSNNKVVNFLLINGSTGNPSKKSFTSNLDKGTYNLSITTKGPISNPSGKYTFKADFTPVETNVTEPNNNINEAQELDFGDTIHGFLSSENKVDVFKFTLNSEKKISLDFKAYIKSAGIALKDEDQKIVWASMAQGDEENPGVKSIDKKLSPGTYYLFVDKQLNFTGKYDLTVDTEGSWDEVLPFNKTVNGELSLQNKQNTYKAYIEKPGRAYFDIKTYIPGTIVEIKDVNRKSVYKTIVNGEETNPVSKVIDIDLNSGLYYLCISTPAIVKTGRYSIEASVSKVNNNETEPNDTIYQAQKILPSGSKINGLLAENDDTDVYKVTVSEKGKLSFDFKSYIESVIIELKDKDQTSLFKKSLAASYSEPKEDTYDADLDPGTYYLYVRKDILKHTGKYSFKTRFSSNETNVVEPNDSIANAQPINLNNKINGYISATNEIDVFKFTLQEPCRLKVNLTSNIKSANMEIKDANQCIVLNSSFQGTDTEPGVKNVEKKFNAGTYYVTITKQYTYTGKYSLTIGSPYGWIQNVDSTYSYLDSNGDYVKFCWKAIDGTWYNFDRYGIMKTGWLQNEDTWYYLSPNGGMATNWYKVGDTWYFFSGNGSMQTGWLQQGNTWYLLNSSGAMQTGWINNNGIWYYTSSSGAMATGWQQIDGAWYYFYDNGTMACNTNVGGYYLDVSGAWR